MYIIFSVVATVASVLPLEQLFVNIISYLTLGGDVLVVQ
jgi:hypothetical protein